jgi:cytochrome c7-like protein
VALKTILLALAVLAAWVGTAHAQLSPGDLSRFHQSLEGARNCQHCHEAGRGVTADKCLTCHTALGQRIAAGKGLHARPGYTACERCHVEHQGRAFEIVFWGKEGKAAFDHGQTGFRLEGRHAALGCETCHNARKVQDAAALARGGANLQRTFLGLGTGCTSCHADPHAGQFHPRGCADCHGQDRWKPPARFDHEKTAFPLTGRHERVTCAQCHPAAAGQPARFKGTPFATCASCHKDPHAGRLGTQCASCHTTEGWSRIEPGRFDHSKTRFPLTGLHRSVTCAKCHPAAPGGGLKFQGIAFQQCSSCHQDPHAGRLGAQCAGCHRTDGWRKVEGGKFNHDQTGYPLRGRHAKVECDSCHEPGRPRKLPHARCTDCHEDRHAGQLAMRADGGRCEACHDVEGFEPAHFTPEDHAKTKLPLDGAHLAVACDDCHEEVPRERLRALGFARGPGSGSTEQIRFASTRCVECHQDPHRGQTAKAGACETCHRVTAWPEVVFDHARTRFPLAASHAAVPCRGCHPGNDGALAFSGRPTECAGCHQDPHAGRFARSGRTDCARCHEPTQWIRVVNFDHDRETGFKLEGAHRAVPCAGCHRQRTADGRFIMKYAGIGRSCADCHAGGVGPNKGGGS